METKFWSVRNRSHNPFPPQCFLDQNSIHLYFSGSEKFENFMFLKLFSVFFRLFRFFIFFQNLKKTLFHPSTTRSILWFVIIGSKQLFVFRNWNLDSSKNRFLENTSRAETQYNQAVEEKQNDPFSSLVSGLPNPTPLLLNFSHFSSIDVWYSAVFF